MTKTEEKIMQAALQLFSENGLKGTTIRDIAKIAVVNPSAINYHFGSKENLYRDVIGQMAAERLQSTLVELGDDLTSKSKNDFTQRLKSFTDNLVKRFIEEHELYNLMTGEMMQGLPYAKEEFSELMPELIERITKFIANGKKKGYVKKTIDPNLSAFMFFSIIFYPFHFKEILKDLELIDLDEKKNRSKYIKLSLAIFVDGLIN